MRYRLIVVTHGGEETREMLGDTLASFAEMVTPSPAERVLIEDGPPKQMRWRGARLASSRPLGFCKTAEMAWMTAATAGVSWNFWLEHDFRFARPVDLEEMAEVLALNPEVAQMSLMRQPVNLLEIERGGVVGIEPDAFVPRISSTEKRNRNVWLEHGRYWTTNPSLFHQSIPAEVPWPEVGSECEGHLTIALRQAGYSFGIWGEGEPWVEHVGERTGFGY